jgi:uncharacterized protein (DUF2147 family)
MLTLAVMMLLGMPPRNAMGDWETPAHSVVRVEACGAEVCLRVVKLPPDAPATLDVNNPEKSLRTRALCGLVVGTGFREDGSGKLAGGRLYDPKSGRTYSGTIAVAGDALMLRGYWGVALLGRSETWRRVGDVTGCR